MNAAKPRTIIAKYDGFCKVTRLPILAGSTELVSINGKWQVYQAPAQAAQKPATAEPVAYFHLADFTVLPKNGELVIEASCIAGEKMPKAIEVLSDDIAAPDMLYRYATCRTNEDGEIMFWQYKCITKDGRTHLLTVLND